MSVGILVRVRDLSRAQALYRGAFGLEGGDTVATTRGEMLVIRREPYGGCLFVLEAENAPVDQGIPLMVDAGAAERAQKLGVELRGRVDGVPAIADFDGNVFWAFNAAKVVETYETGTGAPILPLIHAVERGRLESSWLRVWGHGGRDPVATAWAVSVGYLGDLLAILGWRTESQLSCDIHNQLASHLEHPFIEEQLRQSVRTPTLRDAELAAQRFAERRQGHSDA